MGQFEVIAKPSLSKDVKRYKKKYPHIQDDLAPILIELESNPELGKPMSGFGEFYKIRVECSDLRRGKRGGYRLITRPRKQDNIVEVWWVYPVSMEGDPGTAEVRQEIERRIKQEREALSNESQSP